MKPPSVGESVERYQIAEVHEQDDDGGTYRVWDLDSGVQHVLKLRFAGAAPELREALRREFRIQHSLVHPHIAHASRLLELDDGAVGMVLARANAGALSTWMTGAPVAPRMRRVAIRAVLEGLAAAHEAGFVHRDIKPENVLMAAGSDGIGIQIADFGLARDLGAAAVDEAAGLSLHFSLLGTPGYMAPEQAADPAAVDRRADLYSVGCLLCEMLTGELPIDPDTSGFMLRLLKGESTIPSSAPAWAVPVLESLLAADPADRPESAEAVLRTLTALGEA